MAFFFGLPLPDYEFFDGETGLPATTYGCTIALPEWTYVRSWNATVRGACREGRIRVTPPPGWGPATARIPLLPVR